MTAASPPRTPRHHHPRLVRKKKEKDEEEEVKEEGSEVAFCGSRFDCIKLLICKGVPDSNAD